MSGIYERTIYTNEYIDYLYDVNIIEYDMKRAGLSIIKQFSLLDVHSINYLDSLPKDIQTVEIGKLQISNKDLRDGLSEGFVTARKMFFEANGLDDTNVLSIKKDAIFALVPCDATDFGEIKFAKKNEYTSFYKFDRHEFYYYDTGLDIKGISDDKLLLHADYMLSALHQFMYLMENSSTDRVIRYVKEFITHYKSKELELGFYRELNADSLFRIAVDKSSHVFGAESIDDKEHVLINYNYNTYLLPLIDFVLRKG